jgi:hypothetical protein
MTVSPELKREHAAFISDPAKVAKYVNAAMSHGFFVALEQARIDKTIGPALFSHEYRRYYGMLLDHVREALKETKHIEAALRRMEMTAQHGRQRQSVERLQAVPDDRQFQEDLRIFQGWLASLFETYVTIFSYIEGTQGATRKINEFASASLKLTQTRQKEGRLSKHSELFSSLAEL